MDFLRVVAKSCLRTGGRGLLKSGGKELLEDRRSWTS